MVPWRAALRRGLSIIGKADTEVGPPGDLCFRERAYVIKLHKFNFQVMGGPAEIQLFAEPAAAQECARLIENEARRIEKKFSRFDPDSVVSRINSRSGKAPYEVDQETASLLDYAAVCHQQSAGMFDITSGILRKAWDFKSTRIPTAGEIDALLPLIGWHKVEWRKPFLRLPELGMQIDFGGIGKEYAVDRCVALALTFGINSGLVNFAGDVRVIGPQPEGCAWKIGLIHPRIPRAVLASIELSSGAIATSGDYERFIDTGGKRYCHILNPKTGWPVHDFQSASVLADSCLLAGTASTTAMLLGLQRGRKLLKDLGLPFILCDAQGTVESFPPALL